MKKMEKEWMKLIDDVENDRSHNTDPYFKVLDFIREKSTIEDKRAIVQEVERRIKKVVNREDNNPDGFFRNFSDTERDLLDDLLGLREVTLDEMMLHPTAAEVERLSQLNDKLYKLTLECFEQCRNLWLTLYRSPYKVDDHLCICYAMHALHTHEPWCLPDILRMDDFTVSVELKYDRNISEQRDIRYADDGNETDPHWPENVPCLDRTQKG